MGNVVIPFKQERLDLAGIAMVVDDDWSINAKEAVEVFGAQRMRMRADFSEDH